jgi:hypothetical protein
MLLLSICNLVHPLEVRSKSPTYLSWFVPHLVSEEWSKVHLHRIAASSGTCDRVGCNFSCYSWWSPPPRRLGAAVIIERRVVIVSGSDRWFVRSSCAFPTRDSQKATLVNCSWLVYPHLVLVLTALLCRARRVMPISAEPPSECVITTRT